MLVGGAALTSLRPCLVGKAHPDRKSPHRKPGTPVPDIPNKRGRRDQSRVSQQPNDIDRIKKKFDLPAPLIKKVVEQEGPSRKKSEDYLDTMKKNGKK
jgi:hypothetical protein